MASDPEISPRTRHRFGFTGKRKRTNTMPSTVDSKVSSDEILDSLTRQASSQVGLSETNTRTLEILADEDPEVLDATPLSGVSELSKSPGGRFGQYVIAVMSIGGMAAVWFYSSGRTLISSNFFNDIIQRTNVRSVFGNPLEIGVVSLISLVVASWIAFRRRRFARILNASVG